MRKLFTAALLLLPGLAFALDYSNTSRLYADSPFSNAEAAGISLLTNLRVVSGNPDGTFAASRGLNRAEFMKIAVGAYAESAAIDDLMPESTDCFPDVRSAHWFSEEVCIGEEWGWVSGYPDGRFHPERPVNHAEALKVLTLAFGYEIAEDRPGAHWYERYAAAAQERKTALPIALAFDAPLTRGQMARLTAAFVAEAAGELNVYRARERGEAISSASRSSVSSSSSISSASSSSSVSSASSSVSSLPDFPSRSRFLIAGERSKVIAGNTFFAALEPMYVERAEVILENARDAIDTMFVVDADGVQLGQLSLDKVFDPNELTWRGTFLNKSYHIEKDKQKTLGVEVRMKPRNQGGTSEEMVQVDQFKITTLGEWSNNSVTSGASPNPYPKHQTAMGRITAVSNADDTQGILPLGPSFLLAAFNVTGTAVENVTLRVEHLEFQVSKSSFVDVTNWKLGIPDSSERYDCSTSGNTVSCTNIPESLGTLGGGSRVFRLYGDVTLQSGATEKDLQITLNLAGDTQTTGAVRWTDGTGHFNWVELDQPLARGTVWR